MNSVNSEIRKCLEFQLIQIDTTQLASKIASNFLVHFLPRSATSEFSRHKAGAVLPNFLGEKKLGF